MQRAHCYEGARDCEGVRGRRGEAAVAATATVAATAAEVGCNGLERGWRTVSVAREREGNDRLDSNQHFTACKTVPFCNIASSVPAPLNSA